MKYKNKLFRHLRKGSVLTSWIILMFALILIACFMMGIYFYNMNATLERNLTSYNAAKTQQISTEVDAAATRLALQAKNISDMIENDTEALLSLPEKRYEFLSKLAVQLELNRDIFDIYVYLSQKGEVVSGTGITKEKYFHSGYFDTGKFTYEEWKDFLRSSDSDYFGFFPFTDVQNKNWYKLTYILDMGDSGKVMVVLNTETITAGDPYFSKLFVVDKKNSIYNLYGSHEENLKIKKLPQEGDMAEYTDGSYISCVSSKLANFKYIFLTEKNVLNKDLNKLHASSLMYMFVFLIVGLILAWVFSLRQYKPLRGILDTLKKITSDTIADKENEYVEVENSIAKMLQEKSELLKKAKRNEVYIRERAIAMFLNGRTLSKESHELLPRLDSFMGVLYIVYNEENAMQFENDFELLQVAVKNISKEIFSEVSDVYLSATDLTGTVSLLLSFDNIDETTGARISTTAQRFIEIIKSQLGIDSDVVLGKITDNYENIPGIYSEIKDASLLCLYGGNVIDVSTLTHNEFDAYSYSIHTEMGIISCIKKGDYKGAYELIRREINEFLYQKNYPIYIIRCFMVELAGTILKAVGEIEKENSEITIRNTNNVGKLFSATTIAEMELLLQEYLKEVCDCIEENACVSASPVCEEIKQYVRENYADPDLNVNAVAAKFYLNPAYLSNMFKRNTGIKLLEYINRVRIDEAKKMMISNPQMSVEEIAEKSGFANSRTFRRIFSKNENTSPSKFINP